jgi:ketosteroid isomerase-like protein
MSRENVARYRVPPVRERSRRTLAQHIFVRFPSLARLYGSALIRLPVTSRLRRELAARGVRDNAEAWNRGDREAVLAGLDPEFELNLIGEAVGADFEDRYRGREGVMRFWTAVDEAWESNRLEPQEIIDFGDRYLALYRNRGRGRGSGVEVDHDIGLHTIWSGGRIVRVDYYWSQEEALEAAGLSG